MSRRGPWWIPPFLGRVPEGVGAREVRLLGAVSLALLFEEYDQALVTAALKQIAAGLHIPESELSLLLALIRLGALPAFLVIPLADRVGRRPLFVFSVAATGVLTFLSAFAQDATQFVLLQAAARVFIVAGAALSFVMIAEEFPAAHRGWGIGMLSALGAIGHAFSAGAYSQIERLPYGFRALYAFGVIPVLLVPWFMRLVPETRRFAELAAQRAQSNEHSFRQWLAPLRALATTHPMRAAGVATASFVSAFAGMPSFQLSGYYTQAGLGFGPGQFAILVVVGGAIGILGNIVAGRLGDTWGRKRVGFALLAMLPAASFALYQGPPVLAVFGWVALVFCAMGGRTIARSFSSELFPTSQRSAASGLGTVSEALGAVGGLLAVHAYEINDLDDLRIAVPLMSAGSWIAALVLMRFPETRQRELEEIG